MSEKETALNLPDTTLTNKDEMDVISEEELQKLFDNHRIMVHRIPRKLPPVRTDEEEQIYQELRSEEAINNFEDMRIRWSGYKARPHVTMVAVRIDDHVNIAITAYHHKKDKFNKHNGVRYAATRALENKMYVAPVWLEDEKLDIIGNFVERAKAYFGKNDPAIKGKIHTLFIPAPKPETFPKRKKKPSDEEIKKLREEKRKKRAESVRPDETTTH